jgi:hypothetical protein
MLFIINSHINFQQQKSLMATFKNTTFACPCLILKLGFSAHAPNYATKCIFWHVKNTPHFRPNQEKGEEYNEICQTALTWLPIFSKQMVTTFEKARHQNNLSCAAYRIWKWARCNWSEESLAPTGKLKEYRWFCKTFLDDTTSGASNEPMFQQPSLSGFWCWRQSRSLKITWFGKPDAAVSPRPFH